MSSWQVEEKEALGGLTGEVFRRDEAKDYIGIYDWLKSNTLDQQDVLFCIYKLLTEGRFRATYVVATAVTESGMTNPTIDLAHALGGALFSNEHDEVIGAERLRLSLDKFTPTQMDLFRNSLAIPVYCQLMGEATVRRSPELEAKLVRILAPAIPDLKVEPAPSRPLPRGTSGKPQFNFVLFNQPMPSWYRTDDVLRPMMGGLSELGYRVQVNGAWNNTFIQIFSEYFVHDTIIEVLADAKNRGATLGLLLTEDPSELRDIPAHAGRWDYLLRTIPYFDFFWDLSGWNLDAPIRWRDYVPNDKVAAVRIGSYYDPRPLIANQRSFAPTLDFLIYGRQTAYRDRWAKALRSLGFLVEYSHIDTPNWPQLAPPDFVSQSMLGSAAIMLDIPRNESVTALSATRLAFALQNNLPILVDDRTVLDNSIFDGYVTKVSLIELAMRRRFFLSQDYRTIAESKAAAWRQRYPMAQFMREALAVVPGIG